MGNINEGLQNLLYLVIVCVLPLAIRYVVVYLQTKVNEMSSNIENEKLRQYINAANESIGTAVLSVQQVFVDSLKKSGNFGKEAQIEAKNKALALAKQLINEEGEKAIKTLYGDYEAYLESAIEAMVRDTKITV